MAPTAEEFEVLLSQLKARMDRGQGETIYEIGIGGERAESFINFLDPLCWAWVPCSFLTLSYASSGGCSSNGLSEDQMEASLATVQSLAVACQADMKLLRQKPAEEGLTAECLVRRKVEEDDFLEVR